MESTANKSAVIPTESLSSRTEYTKTYTVAPGRCRAYASAVPLHARNASGRWEEVDAGFRAVKDADALAQDGRDRRNLCL